MDYFRGSNMTASLAGAGAGAGAAGGVVVVAGVVGVVPLLLFVCSGSCACS